jgi:hypothetical protein
LYPLVTACNFLVAKDFSMAVHRWLANANTAILFVVLSFFAVQVSPIALAEEADGQRATPWTSSRILGSPDPALPYKTHCIFAQVELKQPTDIVWLPDAERWIATQFDGQILSFSCDRDKAVAQPLMDMRKLHDKPVSTVVSRTFHHDLKNQPWCYVCYAFN